MNRRFRSILAAICSLAVVAAHAATCPSTGLTCNLTISPGTGIPGTIEGMSAGQTLCLNAGTYTSAASGTWGDTNSFGIGKPVMVCGLGAAPGNTILQSASTSGDFTIKFDNYVGGSSANNAGLANVQVQGAKGGIQVNDFTTPGGSTLSGITIKDVIVSSLTTSGTLYGVYMKNADKITLDNVTVTSGNSGFLFQNVTNSLLMNSSVVSTSEPGSNALAVIGGSNNVIVGNTLGSTPGPGAYTIQAGGVNFYDTTNNRFENNTIQGQHDDGLDFTASGVFSGQGIAAAAPVDNYAGKNSIISTGLANGLGSGSGIWPNCSADRAWLYGNDVHGTPECGVCTWQVKSNMVLGNSLHDNGIAGVVNSGGLGNATDAFCTAGSNAFRERPINNYFLGNYIYFNKGEQLTIWDADSTTVASNFFSVYNGFGGPARSDGGSFGQAAFAFNEDRGINNNGVRIFANSSHDNLRGLQSDDQHTVGIEFAYNRMIQTLGSAFSRYELPGSITSTNWDGGSHTGGNYWTLHPATGDPSVTTPYGTSGSGNPALGVYDSASNTTGKIVDRYPFQHEDFGKGGTVTVSEPRSGLSFARGTKRTVRWYGPGCAYVDIKLDGTTSLASNTANTGYAIVTIPIGTSIASHNIAVTCKDSNGGTLGSGSSASFNVKDSTLQIMAPGRDDVFDAGTQIVIGWKKGAAVGTVTAKLSTDGGATFPTTLGSSAAATSIRVNLPTIASVQNAVIEVTDGASLVDMTDGYFAIRGSSGAGFTNITPGRNFTMGQLERLEWASPTAARSVDITGSVGGVVKTVATGLPDRGSFDWIVPEWATTGTLTLSATFRNASGTQIGSVVTNASGNAIFPTVVAPPNPPRLLNISTRGQILTGFDVMIGGFVISGPTSKTVVVRAIGPSLANFGVTGTIADPTLTLTTSGGTTIATNDNWQTQTVPSDVTRIQNAALAPSSPFESALIVTLSPGAYTAIVSGMNGAQGVGLVEVYEIDHPETDMINISTRGRVGTGGSVMIGGFVVTGSGPQNVVIRAIGPSLANFGVATAMANPTLAVTKVDGTPIASNDDWMTDVNASQVSSAGFAPSDPHESALYLTLQPGAYTAIVSGVGGTTGTGLVEVYTVP